MFMNQLRNLMPPQQQQQMANPYLGQQVDYGQMANMMNGQMAMPTGAAPSGSYGAPGQPTGFSAPMPGQIPQAPMQNFQPQLAAGGGMAAGQQLSAGANLGYEVGANMMPTSLPTSMPPSMPQQAGFQQRPAPSGGMPTGQQMAGGAAPQRPIGNVMNALPASGAAPQQGTTGLANAQARQQQMQRGAFYRAGGRPTGGQPQNTGTRPNPSTGVNNYARGLQSGVNRPQQPIRPLGNIGTGRR
jgi:hypothetical protein